MQHAHESDRRRWDLVQDIAATFNAPADDGAGPWVRMQAAYDAWHAERSTDTSAIPTIKAA